MSSRRDLAGTSTAPTRRQSTRAAAAEARGRLSLQMGSRKNTVQAENDTDASESEKDQPQNTREETCSVICISSDTDDDQDQAQDITVDTIKKRDQERIPPKLVKFSCGICGLGYRTKADIEIHMNGSHRDIENRSTFICDRSKNKKRKRDNSRKDATHSSRNMDEVADASLDFERIKKLNREQNPPNLVKYSCGICGLAYINRSRIEAHMNASHSDMQNTDTFICQRNPTRKRKKQARVVRLSDEHLTFTTSPNDDNDGALPKSTGQNTARASREEEGTPVSPVEDNGSVTSDDANDDGSQAKVRKRHERVLVLEMKFTDSVQSQESSSVVSGQENITSDSDWAVSSCSWLGPSNNLPSAAVANTENDGDEDVQVPGRIAVVNLEDLQSSHDRDSSEDEQVGESENRDHMQANGSMAQQQQQRVENQVETRDQAVGESDSDSDLDDSYREKLDELSVMISSDMYNSVSRLTKPYIKKSKEFKEILDKCEDLERKYEAVVQERDALKEENRILGEKIKVLEGDLEV